MGAGVVRQRVDRSVTFSGEAIRPLILIAAQHGLPFMGIWLGGGLGRGFAGRGCRRRTDDGGRDLVVAAAVEGVSLA